MQEKVRFKRMNYEQGLLRCTIKSDAAELTFFQMLQILCSFLEAILSVYVSNVMSMAIPIHIHV